MTVPLFPFAAIPKPDLQIDLLIEFHYNESITPQRGSLQWFMNNSTFHANYK